MTFVRERAGLSGRFLDSSTKCLRYRPRRSLISFSSELFLSCIKRFLGTKHFAEFIWFHLKRFRGTKLPEDCPLWPAAYEVERIAPTGRTGPHGPTGRRTWDPSFPYHMFDVYGFPRNGQTHETT